MASKTWELTERDVVRLRLANLLLTHHDAATPGDVVTWLGAMQAQDLASGKWSFGARLPAMTEADVDAAIEAGEILRTWPMRGTIHFVPPADARWMLATTGVRALAGAEARRAYLGLDLATVDRAAELLEEALRGGKRLTRSQAAGVLHEGGVESAGQHLYHLIWYVCQIGVTCIGPNDGKEQTVVLLDEWAPRQRHLDPDAGLAELALRYFRSHGPTSHTDFARWAGIGAKAARTAIESNGTALTAATFGGVTLWMAEDVPDRVAELEDVGKDALVLPGFDEFILGYKDRTLVLPDEHKERIVPGGNGIFKPTVVDRGAVVGTWRRTTRKTSTAVTVLPFEPMGTAAVARVTAAFQRYGHYLGREVTVAFE